MTLLDVLLFLNALGGGLVVAGIAYPGMAREKGWPIGSASGGTFWNIWFFFGGLAYLGGMTATWGLWGLIAAFPLGLLIGCCITLLLKQNAQLAAYLGPALCNLWFFAGTAMG